MKKIFVLIVCLISCNALANESQYTSLEEKQCKVLRDSSKDPKAEIDYFTMQCPGREGLTVMVEGGDARTWLVIKRAKNEVYNMWVDLAQNALGQFPLIAGKVLEWRYDNNKKLIGLIVRVDSTIEESQKIASRLYVLRYQQNKFCFLSSETTNDLAQKKVDSQQVCKP